MKLRPFLLVATAFLLVGGCLSLPGGTVTDSHTHSPSTSSGPVTVSQSLPSENYFVRNGTLYVNRTESRIGGTSCRSVGFDAVKRTVEHRLDRGVWASMSSDRDGIRIKVLRVTELDRDGNVIDTPAMSYRRLESATPGEAIVAIETNRSTISCEFSITVENQTVRND